MLERKNIMSNGFGIIGERLTLAAFSQLSGSLAGMPYVKLVVDREKSIIHFVNHTAYEFHSDYIAEQILNIPRTKIESEIDAFNKSVYFDLSRRFYLGILALHTREEKRFFTLETVEVDTMDGTMVKFFFDFVKNHVDPSIPLLFKPANHLQENIVTHLEPTELPRVYTHEIFASVTYIALNPGKTTGRIRAFTSEQDYQKSRVTLEWYDIVVMSRVPDDIPRISGIINSNHTTPLSHTNILASGWQIPNCIQLNVLEKIQKENFDMQWVEYSVVMDKTEIHLQKVEPPQVLPQKPSWSVDKIQLEEPQTTQTPIVSLETLRMSDRYKYGTKAANLGELHYLLQNGSERLIGFYRIPRPPRTNLLSYLSQRLGVSENADLTKETWKFLKDFLDIPRGIAIPFSVQQEFLCSSPKIQQAIGKLKMALELNARQVDSLCITLQQMIRSTRMPDKIRNYIDSEIAHHLGGVSSFVVRSSSNAEDLEGFSAAGIYESLNHVTSAEKVFDSIKQVWASLISPRSVRLRQDVGISLDDSYMGVVIQEEMKTNMGGVLVTTNPTSRYDFRNVYLNISNNSVTKVVQGTEQPYQCLYNTVEGGGRTLSFGSLQEDLSQSQKQVLQKLALAGRLLQSHFSPDYTFSTPIDMEWLAQDHKMYLLQLRPYSI